jgi:hypothetical protein
MRNNDFEKQFNRIAKVSIGTIIFGWVISLAFLGFIVWVIYKLVTHFL